MMVVVWIIRFIWVILVFLGLTGGYVLLTGKPFEMIIPIWYGRWIYFGIIPNEDDTCTIKFYLLKSEDE